MIIFWRCWNHLIFFCSYGKLSSFPTRSGNEFEIHVVEKVDCKVLNESIAIVIRDKKYEQNDILAVIGQKNDLILFDDFLSFGTACKSSDIKMAIWFDKQLSLKDRLAGLNQIELGNYMFNRLLPPNEL